MELEADPKKLEIDVGGVYMDKKANFELDASRNISVFGCRQTIDWSAHQESNLENYIDFKNVGKYEPSGVVLHKLKEHDTNIGAVGHLRISGSGKDEDIK